MSSELQKLNGQSNSIPSHKNSSFRRQKSGSKRNPNVAGSFQVPLPSHQQGASPLFHTVVPPSHVPIAGYAYQPLPGSFPSIEVPMQAFVHPAYGSIPPAWGETNAYVADFSTRRPNLHEPSSHPYPGWNNQQPYGSNKNILGQQGVGPRAFVRPPFIGPAPGFITGPIYPGMFCNMLPYRYYHTTYIITLLVLLGKKWYIFLNMQTNVSSDYYG